MTIQLQQFFLGDFPEVVKIQARFLTTILKDVLKTRISVLKERHSQLPTTPRLER